MLSPDPHLVGSPVQLSGREEHGSTGSQGHGLGDVIVDSVALKKAFCTFPGLQGKLALSSSLSQDKLDTGQS